MGRRRLLTSVLALGTLSIVAPASGDPRPPIPETAFIDGSPGGAPCEPQTTQDETVWNATVGPMAAEGICERLRFAYGPISVKPGQNDALIVPITIEKPAYDGYVLRFKPDLVYADGTAPYVDEIHLHHAVWLKTSEASLGYNENLNPFFAAGEEKTIATFPTGYGYPVNDTDSWLLLYMVHNYTQRPSSVWITYDVDYVRKDAAEAYGISPIQPFWMDVQRKPIAPEAPDTPANPVFNVQKGFGHDEADPLLGRTRRVCTWPAENCSRHDPYGRTSPQQGQALDPSTGEPWNLRGADKGVSAAFDGTLVWVGGHLHPGGIRDEVLLDRPGYPPKQVFVSEAIAWDRSDPAKAGSDYDSWDFSMTTTGAQLGWKVRVKQGDTLWLNATYDAEISWYENMGIVVGYIAPGDTSGLDPFAAGVTTTSGTPTTASAILPEGWRAADCTPSPTNLCTRGAPTHGHLAESSRFGGCAGCPGYPSGTGPVLSTIPVAGFQFGPASRPAIVNTGLVPAVRAGTQVTFVSADTGADAWHTITRCKAPCTGGSGLAYPKADGGDGDPSNGDDFDSSEIGYGLFLSPAKSHPDQTLERMWDERRFDYPAFSQTAQDGVLWRFTPEASDVGETVTFFCRIHIGMRGAVRVVP